MPETLKERASRFISKRRQSRLVRALHAAAAFVESAYENDEWDMTANGETAVLRRLAPAGFGTVLDVGAHVGDWSIEALRQWPSARVHAFEVAPQTFDRLVQRCAASGLSDRATLNCFGLSDRHGSAEMYFYPEHPNLTCDRPRHVEHASVPFEARLVSGDSYLRQHRIEAVDFLKIDVEGAEHLVLQGFSDALQAGRLHCIQFEYGAFSIDTRVLLRDYYELLGSQYWIGKVYPTHVDFREYDWTMENFRFCNFLCVSRNRPALRDLAQGLARPQRRSQG